MRAEREEVRGDRRVEGKREEGKRADEQDGNRRN